MAYVKSIEVLADICEEKGYPYWAVYSGTKTTGNKLDDNFEEEDASPDNVFDGIENALSRFDRGTYTIVLKKAPKHSIAQSAKYHIRLKSEYKNAPGAPGGFASQFKDMMMFWRFMSQQSDHNISGMEQSLRAEIAQEYRIKELERKFAEKNKESPRDKLLAMALNKAPDIIERVLPGSRPVVAGVLQTDIQDDPPPAQDRPEAPATGHFSIDDAVNACLSIQQKLDANKWINLNVNELLWKLDSYLGREPAQAAIVVGQL